MSITSSSHFFLPTGTIANSSSDSSEIQTLSSRINLSIERLELEIFQIEHEINLIKENHEKQNQAKKLSDEHFAKELSETRQIAHSALETATIAMEIANKAFKFALDHEHSFNPTGRWVTDGPVKSDPEY